MRYTVPTLSWLVCVGVSLWFTFAWSFSGMDTSGPYMGASAYLWAAEPALAIGTWLLARPPKSANWIASAVSALPWAAFPWLAMATFVPRGERQQWFSLATALAIGFAACVAVPVCLRVACLQRLPETGEAK
jgi:hypothetical protein